MSISATPSIWNAVESAIRGANRSSAHSSSSCGSCALELDRELPRLQLVDQLHTHAASSSRLGRARGRPGSQARRPTAGRENAANCSSALRCSIQPPTSPATAASSSSLGTRRKSGRPIAASGPSAAAHEDVVGLPALALVVARRSCPGSRGRRPSAARRRAGSRRGAAAGRRRRRRSASSSPSISESRRVFVSVTEKLQCGSPVQAIERAADRVDVEREAELRRARRRRRSTRSLGHAGDDEVLLARDRGRRRRCGLGEVGERDHLVARDEAEVDRDADRRRGRRAARGRRCGRRLGSSGGSV